MADFLHKKLMMLAITLLDKQDGMPIEEWDLLRAVLEEEKTGDARDIIDNVATLQERVFLDETWVEENYHRFE